MIDVGLPCGHCYTRQPGTSFRLQHANPLFRSMISRWPIRTKLIIGILLLMCSIGALATTSFVGVYAFRGLTKSLRLRAPELTFSSRLAGHVSRLMVAHDLYQRSTEKDGFRYFDLNTQMLKDQFDIDFRTVEVSFQLYRELLESNQQLDEYNGIKVMDDEQAAVAEFQATLNDVRLYSENWESYEIELTTSLLTLDELSKKLPTYLHSRLRNFSNDARGQYRTWIGMSATAATVSAVLLIALLRLFYVWILRPLRVLVHGSRLVAGGNFKHRIALDSQDEMTELASAMNNMTQRFQEIRDDLDQQVKQRTKEVVRSEQLASVGFLAAGVAHEINNPLASIALCAESLESRLRDIIQEDDTLPDEDHNSEVSIARDYLRMMQDEAFRCKEITERLLDFSRLGDVEKQNTDITDLVQSVIGMVKHLGNYKEKTIEFEPGDSVYAPVNSQEIKQVVLNLLTNALDSLESGGRVNVSLDIFNGQARLTVADNGCGMTPEVQEHLFEPFFTRRRSGQGTGLGMSITYRIVNDHDGDIGVLSAGPGKGSTIIVTLPLTDHEEENQQQSQPKHRRHAA